MAFGGSNRGKMCLEPSYGTSETPFCCCAVALPSLTLFQRNRRNFVLLLPLSAPLRPLLDPDRLTTSGEALTPLNPPVIKGP